MTVEKEVVVHIKVPKESRNGAAFEDLATNARKLDADTKRAGQAVADMLREMNHVTRITSALKGMGVEAKAAGEAAARMLKDVGDGARVGQREIEKLAAGMKALGHAEAAPRAGPGFFQRQFGGPLAGAGRGMLADAGSGLGRAAWPTAILGAASQGLQIAQDATHPEEGLNGRRFFEQAVRKSQDIPIFGSFFGLSNEAQQLKERDRRIADARNRVGVTEQRMAIQGQYATGRRTLEEDRIVQQGRSIDVAAGRQTFSASQANQAASERAQEAARARNRNPAEVAAEFAHAGAMHSLEIGQRADREKLGQVVDYRQQQVGQARTEVEQARKGAAGLASAKPDETAEQALERRLAYENQLVQLKEKENQLSQTQAALLDAQKQQGAQLAQQHDQRLAKLGQERDRLSGVIAAEKDRLKGEKISFGKLTREEQERAIKLGEKANRGERLDRESLDFLSGVQGTEKVTNKQYEARAEKNFGAFAQTFGRNEELKNAEAQRAKIENNINVDLNLNAESVADQLEKTLLPKIMQMLTDLKQQSGTATDRLANQQRLQTGALTQ
jgi:hypothetical protein